jgi:hypothetical protein
MLNRSNILVKLDSLAIFIHQCIENAIAFMPVQAEFWQSFL